MVSTGELFLTCARLPAGWVTTTWPTLIPPWSVNHSVRLRKQVVEGVARGVDYRPRH